jgi:cell division protein FtsZ
VKLVVSKEESESVDVDYDRPTVLRNKPKSDEAADGGEVNMEYLDIPAFLRRQAD